MDTHTQKLLGQLEATLAKLRLHLTSQPNAAKTDTPTQPDPGSLTQYDATDWARRQRPEWERRGRLLDAVARDGGEVPFSRWKELGEECGYRNGRGLNGFFAGNPSVVTREGDLVILTERGYSAADYWRERYGGTERSARDA